MNFLLYAVYSIVLPLWIFGGLYLAVEIAEHLKRRYNKNKHKHHTDTRR